MRAAKWVFPNLEVLNYPDGAVEYSLALRKDIARYVRQFKPNVVMIGPYDVEAYGSLNQADHRAASLATLDAVRDADNDWCFRELFEEENLPKWHVNAILVTSSDRPTHFVELTSADVDAAVASLNCHKAYLAHVKGHPKPEDFIPPMLAEQGKATGVENALMFRVYDMGGLRREEEPESE